MSIMPEFKTFEIRRVLSAADAKRGGYPTFNSGNHLPIVLPNGHSTIVLVTSQGRHVTIAACPYEEGGPPKCLEVKHHNTGFVHPTRPELGTFGATIWTPGRPLGSGYAEGKDPCTLVTIKL